MTPEQLARVQIDHKLIQAGWVIQDFQQMNPIASLGVAVREFPTSSGPVDYALFVDGKPVGIVEAKQDNKAEGLTEVEGQSARYAKSHFLHCNTIYQIRFAYEATGIITRFTDYADKNFSSREVFSFHRPETLNALLTAQSKGYDTLRNNMKQFPAFDTTGFRKCQIAAIEGLENSFSMNKPRALIQMATGAGKTFTAITAAYRLLKYARMKRILFLVDTRSLGKQADEEFRAYRPNDDNRSFPEIYNVSRLNSSFIPEGSQVCISTIQRMYSILKGEPLDERAEDESEYEHTAAQPVKEVVYNAKYPPEFFDCIIVDECHRSIYNVWSQVLEYFDSFIIGLTATPDNRTIGYFKQNMVCEYTREQAIIDGVNVGEDIFLIETEVTKNGARILKQLIEQRSRKTRARRWKQMDDDYEYTGTMLDRDVVNPSQIRLIINTFRERVFTQLFPGRQEVPKTLIFAKTDSHADDIVQIVREEFGKGNEFCKKITCRADDPDAVLGEFRNGFNPRIAVTVDMIATGTDVKPIECLIFMRDVRSRNYFEQMKGRGTRVLSKDELQAVTPSATDTKHRFIIVDAVGVTRSKKTDTRPLERKPAVPLKELMLNVATGSRDEDTLTSLANRIIRLNVRLTPAERKEYTQTVGSAPGTLAQKLLDAFDPDVIAARAGVFVSDEAPLTEDEQQRMEEAQQSLITEAVTPFFQPEVRDYIEDVRRSHDQIIDSVNLDKLLFAGFDTDRQADADRTIHGFHEFVEENRDEILALRIIYDQRYKDRPMAISQLKALYKKLQERRITVERLWECYAIRRPDKVRRGTVAQLTDLVSMIRIEMGAAAELIPFAERVDSNFKAWTFRRNAGSVHFTDEQMDWLRMIKDHIAASLSIEPDDLELNPFDHEGGLGRFYELFGDEYEAILMEMNVELVA